ncbi:MAG: hypothetical protein ACF8PN_12565 [Phycisphaerales bacterium]
MTRTHELIVCAVAVGAIGTQTRSQEVIHTVVTDEDTPIRAWGDRPALHDGMVAFLGRDQNSSVDGIYMTPADGLGPFIVVVDRQDRVPNRPGSFFDYLDNPSIYDDTVAFCGGDDHDKNDGIYLGDGGPIIVLEDAWGGDPLPFGPSFSAAGVAFKVEPSLLEPPMFQPISGAAVIAMASSGRNAPGGGQFSSFDIVETPALGGVVAGFTAWVAQPVGDGGVYTYDTRTGDQGLIANGGTTMPGRSETFEFITRVDTDDAHVAFVGNTGFLGFGGHEGVYFAPVGSNGSGPFTVVAEIGDLAPGTNEMFAGFGNVGIDGDLVVFEGVTTDVFGPDTIGLYGWRDGQLFKIIDNHDQHEGAPLIDMQFNFRGLSQDQVAYRVRYEDPNAPWGQGLALYVSTISTGNDLTLSTPALLPRGDMVTLTVSGAEAGESIYVLYSFAGVGSGSCPPQLGGLCLDLLDPVSILANAITDTNGEASISDVVPANAPLREVHTQAVARRGAGGGDSVKSNAETSTIVR